MKDSRSCLGNYGILQDQCDSCPLVLLCMDTAIELDGYYDSIADRIREIEEMEMDARWCYAEEG